MNIAKELNFKYVKKLKIVKDYIKNNPVFNSGQKIKIAGGMLHSIGCPQPKAKVLVNVYNQKSYTRASVHAFIDAKSGTVRQTLPWNHRAGHCASGPKGSGNNTHFSAEMCEPECIKYVGGSTFKVLDKKKAIKRVRTAYESAVLLFADMCIENDLDPLKKGVIISHKEGHEMGIASGHGDPEHLWEGLDLEYTMDTFRRDVNKAMKLMKNNTKKKKFKSYKVRVTADVLNVRKDAGTEHEIIAKIKDKGVYTVVKEKKGGTWGKIKEKGGWVYLNHTKEI